MPLKLVPRLKPNYDIKELRAALRFSQPAINTYEQAFAEKFECGYGTMFSYGRSGLYALFKVWELEDAEIVCPAYTCVVVQHAIVLSGNIPVMVDSASDNFNMDYDAMAQAIGPKTRAIIVTHLFGDPMDVHRIERMVQNAEARYGHPIYIVQDVAHSFGAKWNGEMVTKFGDAAIFGLNISKIINSVFGGMVLTNDKALNDSLKVFRAQNCHRSVLKPFMRLAYLGAVMVAFNLYIYRLINWLERSGLLNRFVKYYDEAKVDFPKDWDVWPSHLEARVGMVQLAKYDDIVRARKDHALQWMELMKNEGVQFLKMREGCTYSHCVGLVENRDEWLERFRKRGVQLGILVEYSVPEMKAYQKYKTVDTPKANSYRNRTINFPVWRGVKVR